ncbi:hypothetical protein JCGZ_24294 [Jatropha curcas]|uniref:Uncharacterized protein n=1 Tax=Jatropha curcas TaxID=180498 RepID=A0A067JLP4_JATCU|nr:protein PIN-LIKES 3 isoform X3 [Jatropha curcas]KDP24916.1 hypothetical protein JCGZ_24294 [Jatropha curcas]
MLASLAHFFDSSGFSSHAINTATFIMQLLNLFVIASMPVLKVLLITALGSFLALEYVNVLGEEARKQINSVVFYVFNPALIGSNLAKTITFESISLLWFMPVNILVTFIIGSILGWLLIKVTATPQHLRGLILGCCAAGNLGNLPLIIIAAICKEKGSPFGAPDVCYTYGIAYASLSMAIGAVFLWSYVYNIMRISSSEMNQQVDNADSDTETNIKTTVGAPKCIQGNYYSVDLSSKESLISAELASPLLPENQEIVKNLSWTQFIDKIKERSRKISEKLNLKALFAPSTIGAIVGFAIGVVPQIRKLLIGASAPLRVIEDSAYLLGDAAIPIVTLIVGGNLLKGLKGSGIRWSLIVGILIVRYVLLPVMGVVTVKTAVHFGLVHSDKLYQFILLLQFAVPPAMNIGTMTQLFGRGQSECSVIMLWTYAFASVSLTLWSTFFLWMLA